MPSGVNRPASRFPVCMSPTMSASLPCVPPGKMTNWTAPSEALRHFSPMACILLWYEVPAGARVPSLSRMIFSAAWRPGAARHRLRVNMAGKQIRRFMRRIRLFRLCFLAWAGTQEKLVGARQEPFGSALHDEIDQSPLRFGVGVDGQGPMEQGLELLQVLLLHAHRFGKGNHRPRLQPLAEHQRPI